MTAFSKVIKSWKFRI